MNTARTPKPWRAWQAFFLIAASILILAITWLFMQPKPEELLPPVVPEFKPSVMDIIIREDKRDTLLNKPSMTSPPWKKPRVSHICTIIRVTDTVRIIDGEECRLYKTTWGDRWILESEEWNVGDRID